MKVKLEWYSEQERDEFLDSLKPKPKEGQPVPTPEEIEAALADELTAIARMREGGRTPGIMRALLRQAERQELIQAARAQQLQKQKPE